MWDYRSFALTGAALLALAACVDQPIAPDSPLDATMASVEHNQAMGLEAAPASLIQPGSDIEVSFRCFGAQNSSDFGSFESAFIEMNFGPGTGTPGADGICLSHPNTDPRGGSVGSFVLRNVPGGEALLNVQLSDRPIDFQTSCTLRFVELPTEPFRCTFESSEFAEQIALFYSDNQALLKAGVIVSFRQL